MCTGVELAFMFGAAFSVGTALSQGSVAEAAAGSQAAAQDIDAIYEEADGKARAAKIRKMGRRAKGEVRSAFGASGVQLGEGTPVTIEEDLEADVEEDALAELITGGRRADASRTAAQYSRMSGKQAKSASRYEAAGSLMSSATSYYGSNWIRQPRAEQEPAPIETRSLKPR